MAPHEELMTDFGEDVLAVLEETIRETPNQPTSRNAKRSPPASPRKPQRSPRSAGRWKPSPPSPS
jgi:hypothetical protein